MTDGSRAGAANLTPLLMVASFAAMIGFLVWLGSTSEGTEAVMMDEETVELPDTSAEAGAVEASLDQLIQQPDQLEGQVIKITEIEIASRLGPEAFFLDLPQSPFLVKMDSAMVARGQSVPPPEVNVTVTGTVHAMNDSIVSAWAEAGAITEGNRPLVEFATHWLEAATMRAVGPTPGGTGGKGGGGGQP